MTRKLSPSQIVFLRGEFFVRKRGDLVLPSGVKVPARELAETMLMVAFLGCAWHGILYLQTHVEQRLFGLWKYRVLLAEPTGGAVPWYEGALEDRLVRLARQFAPMRRHRVQLLVQALVGKKEPTPWQRVVSAVQDTLVDWEILEPVDETGAAPGRYVRRCQLAPDYVEAIIELDTAPTQRLLEDCQHRRPEIWWSLRREIAHGLRHRPRKGEPGGVGDSQG